MPGVALLIFVAWFWLQNLWALYPSMHFEYSVQFAKYVVAFYLVYRLATGPRQTADILLMHVAGCTFLGLLCLYQGRSFGARLDGVGGPGMNDANTLGMYLATGVVVGAVLLLTLKGWRRIALVLRAPRCSQWRLLCRQPRCVPRDAGGWGRGFLSEPSPAPVGLLDICCSGHRSGSGSGR